MAAQDLSQATVGQILIPVTNLERAVEFYRDRLGLPFLFSAPPQMAFFMCGNVRLLVGVPQPGEADRRVPAIYLKVADIDGVHAQLAGRGVAFVTAPHLVHRAENYDLWLADFHDPDGNMLVLMCEKAKG